MCVSQKIITSYPPELSAGGAKQDARKALPAVGRLWPSDDDGDDDDGLVDENDREEKKNNDDNIR